MRLDSTLSIVATVLATLSFMGGIWRFWRDRPRLNHYVQVVTFKNVPHFGDIDQIRFMICNIGFRPIVLVRFRAFGVNGAFSMGIDDEPLAALGIEDRRFPIKIDPGECTKIHPISLAALERNQTDPNNEMVQYDPWRVFAVEDGFGHFHPIEVEDVKRELRIGSGWIYFRGLRKLKRSVATWLFLRRARKRFVQ